MKWLTLLILALYALFSSNAIHVDGTLRGRCSIGLLQLDVLGRHLKVAFAPYGLSSGGRVYYRLQVTS